MFDLNHYLMHNRNGSLAKQITTKSGLKMSVQASSHHYSRPRKDEGPYQQVEVGFPSQQIDDLLPYAEDASTPTDTVYAWVPTELVESIVNNNGGLADVQD